MSFFNLFFKMDHKFFYVKLVIIIVDEFNFYSLIIEIFFKISEVPYKLIIGSHGQFILVFYLKFRNLQ